MIKASLAQNFAKASGGVQSIAVLTVVSGISSLMGARSEYGLRDLGRAFFFTPKQYDQVASQVSGHYRVFGI